jgi:CRISPR-associated protein Csd1
MTILQGLVRYYERLEKTGAVAPPGYAPRLISFAIVLRPGEEIEVQDLREHSTKKPRPIERLVAQGTGNRTSKISPTFLWDNTSYVFGVSKKSKRTAEEARNFKKFHEEVLSGTDDEGLLAFLSFLRTWEPARYNGLRYAE